MPILTEIGRYTRTIFIVKRFRLSITLYHMSIRFFFLLSDKYIISVPTGVNFGLTCLPGVLLQQDQNKHNTARVWRKGKGGCVVRIRVVRLWVVVKQREFGIFSPDINHKSTHANRYYGIFILKESITLFWSMLCDKRIGVRNSRENHTETLINNKNNKRINIFLNNRFICKILHKKYLSCTYWILNNYVEISYY